MPQSTTESHSLPRTPTPCRPPYLTRPLPRLGALPHELLCIIVAKAAENEVERINALGRIGSRPLWVLSRINRLFRAICRPYFLTHAEMRTRDIQTTALLPILVGLRTHMGYLLSLRYVPSSLNCLVDASSQMLGDFPIDAC